MGEFEPKPEEIGPDYERAPGSGRTFPENDAEDKNLKNQVPKKTEKAVEFSEMIKPEELGQLLFLLNKAAKRRRDSARRAFGREDYGLAHLHSEQKSGYYDLKDRVLGSMEKLGLIEPTGIHKHQTSYTETESIDSYHSPDCECDECLYLDACDDAVIKRNVPRTAYLKLYELGGFRFHSIAYTDEAQRLMDKIGHIEDLGEWTSHARLKDVKPRPIREVLNKLYSYLEPLKKEIEIQELKDEIERWVGSLSINQIEEELKSLKGRGYNDKLSSGELVSERIYRLRRAEKCHHKMSRLKGEKRKALAEFIEKYK